MANVYRAVHSAQNYPTHVRYTGRRERLCEVATTLQSVARVCVAALFSSVSVYNPIFHLPPLSHKDWLDCNCNCHPQRVAGDQDICPSGSFTKTQNLGLQLRRCSVIEVCIPQCTFYTERAAHISMPSLRHLSLGLAAALVALLSDRKLHTLALGERDVSLGALTDDEDVARAGSEGAVKDVTDVDDVEATEVALGVDNDTRAAHVTAAGDHDNVSGLELEVVDDLVLDEVELDGVVDLDRGVGVTDGAAVVGDDVGDTLGTELSAADLAELEGSLLGGDAVDGEAALDVVKETEVLARTLNGDDI